MSRFTGKVPLALAVLAVAACTPTIPNRKVAIGDEANRCRALFQKNDELTSGDGRLHPDLAKDDCWKQSLEEHLEYDLLTVEFDDQGWLQDTAGEREPAPKSDQISRLRNALGKIYNENQANGVSIVLFVHGWHHDARPDDRDVVNFRRFLGQIKAAENGRSLAPEPAGPGATRSYKEPPMENRPRVVGLFVGWRGESIDVDYLNAVTFWDRKATAADVAAGSVRELFQELDFVRDCGRTGLDWDDMRRRLSPEERFKESKVGRRNVRMLTIGHSFGGLITWRGMSSEFIGSAVRASAEDYVSRVGDLVVVVNPAFEGARYEALHRAGRRIGSLKDNQLPTVIVATSEADWATRYAFPFARTFSTLLEKTEGPEHRANVLAVGHDPRYRTHLLSKCDPKTQPGCVQTCEASSDKLRQATEKALSADQQALLGEATLMEKLGRAGFQQKTNYLCGALQISTEDGVQPPHNPFWVVYTTGDIMKGHSDIFNDNFVAFFRQMYLGITLARLKNPATTRCTR